MEQQEYEINEKTKVLIQLSFLTQELLNQKKIEEFSGPSIIESISKWSNEYVNQYKHSSTLDEKSIRRFGKWRILKRFGIGSTFGEYTSRKRIQWESAFEEILSNQIHRIFCSKKTYKKSYRGKVFYYKYQVSICYAKSKVPSITLNIVPTFESLSSSQKSDIRAFNSNVVNQVSIEKSGYSLPIGKEALQLNSYWEEDGNPSEEFLFWTNSLSSCILEVEKNFYDIMSRFYQSSEIGWDILTLTRQERSDKISKRNKQKPIMLI